MVDRHLLCLQLLSQLSLAPTAEEEEEEVEGWGAMPSSTRRSSLPTLGLAMLRGRWAVTGESRGLGGLLAMKGWGFLSGGNY